MISDSPYSTDEPLLTPGAGALAGAAASGVMLCVIALLHPAGVSLRELLIRTGSSVFPAGIAVRPGSLLLASTALYASVGAVLGLLYAVCQDRVAVPGLVAVGVFYGVVIWVVSRAVTSWLFGPILRPALHSYAWFLACALYGLSLAGCAAWAQRRRPKSAAVVPID